MFKKDNVAVLEHPQLDSNIATAAALFNEWIKWCTDHNIDGYAMTHITQAYQIIPGKKDV